ncbi:E1-E2 family cation transport ATPase [Blattabacterium sp. (Blattella germanica) str. Bge]|uniref:heavy metal translocating P-type ATPase n=1 Tax=Blattabacterium sp. (Blattella germanica) TaxID=624186 RepID=UPI0001BB61DF|nr:HAD-IC family P-type ATPase [Blattabacterium sp. (Blattella germanica)]ACY40425.1 E1-E2 family cation transport ATPase [Blattabacterium sp. (Blattella germanica) str. Bge]
MKKHDFFDFLDDKKIAEKLIDFNHNNITTVRFLIPSIHCSSCVLVLETLSKFHKNILESTVDFSSKQIWITFNNVEFKLSSLARLLDDMGYRPSINFESIEKRKINNTFDRKLIGKLAISFFCFANIMLLAIPGYVGAYQDAWFLENRNFFHYLMFILSLPVVIFSLKDHVKYAILGFKKHVLNIDVPISIGILVLFLWSCYEIFFDLGSGYFDSISSFSLFLLVSRIFQIHTHNKILSFDKNYKSFYPVLMTRIHEKNEKEEKILLSSLKKGDIILIRNEEIIPADSILIKGNAVLDNSFITGESHLINKKIGDRVYAGSKQKGEAIFLKVIKNVDHSYLSLLWNKNQSNHHKKLFYLNSISTQFSQYFTPAILIISIMSGIYWYLNNDISKIFQTTFSVLIITCPCALVLSTPLIFGNIIRFFSKKSFYIKDIFTMERISAIKTLIFDKTGTITDPNKEKIFFIGNMKYEEKKIVASLLKNSIHPLSQRILSELSIKDFYSIKNFKEIMGKGLEGVIKNIPVKIGSKEYLGITKKIKDRNQTTVFISINNKFVGYFLFRNYYRKGIKKIFQNLKEYKIIILSGDKNELEKNYLKSILPKTGKVLFNQSPENKLNYVKKLQKKGEKIMMFGDGINDCAALSRSEVGVAVSENPTSFFPNCDAFLQSDCLNKIFLFLKISKISSKLVIVNFMISLFYNIIGIYFAVTGNLKPFIAAILMPLSSFSVVFFSIISTWIVSRRFIF